MASANLGYGLPIAAITLGIVLIDRRTVSDWGMTLDRDWWADFGFGLALGTVLVFGIFGVLFLANWVRVTGTTVTTGDPTLTGFVPNVLLLLLVSVGVGNLGEILLSWVPSDRRCRRVRRTGTNPGSECGRGGRLALRQWFRAGHLNNANASPLSTALLAFSGIAYGFANVLTGRLAVPIGYHIAWNLVEEVVLVVPISGNPKPATLIAVTEPGPDLMTGGAFGSEAGVIGFQADVLTIVGVGAYVRWQDGSVSVTET